MPAAETADTEALLGAGPCEAVYARVTAVNAAGESLDSATVGARAITLAVALWVLHFREHLLASLWPGWRALIASWKTILRTGLPSPFPIPSCPSPWDS